MSPPTQESRAEITRLLEAWGKGDKAALNVLVPVVHRELQRLGHRYIQRERNNAGFQTTELVNEVYIRLLDCSRIRWQDRAHFFAVAAQLMRRILVDLARSRRYAKRGGEAIRVTFDKVLDMPDVHAPDWVALDDALRALEALDGRIGRVVEFRFFGGLSVEETAEVLQVSPQTVHRDWRFAKTWLRRELTRGREV
jgi:RNA polymerase sigma factor (TIGR02999 family)